MDFCRFNSSAAESVSFRWIIILMIYLATNILCLSTEATVEHHTEFVDTNSTEWLGKMVSLARHFFITLIFKHYKFHIMDQYQNAF